MTKRLVVTEVSGLHSQTKCSLAVLPDGEQFVACVGSGVALFSVNKREGPKSCRFLYEPPKPLQGSSSNSSPRSSPGSPSSRASSSRLVRINKAQSVDVAFRQKMVAVGETGGYCPRLLLYNLETAECLDIITDQHEFGVPFLRFSPNGNHLVTLGTLNDGFLYVWSVKTGKFDLKHTAKCVSELHDLVWLNDSQIVAVGKRIIKVWTIDWQSGGSISSRNIILGPVADHVFECVWPTGLNGTFLVGTNQGAIYSMPDGKTLVSALEKPVKSLVVVNDLLVCSTPSHIRVYNTRQLDEPLQTITRGSPALYTQGTEAFYLFTAKQSSELCSLPLANTASSELALTAPPCSLPNRILQSRGLQLTSTTGKSVLFWHSDYDNKIVRWPDQIMEIGISNITVADEINPDNLIVGNLSGDILLNGRVISAHDGPISDVQMFSPHLCISCSRDRTIQVWTRCRSNDDWILKQTLVIPSVVLRARLCESSDKKKMALVCCGANKTLYFYYSSPLISLVDDGMSAFPDAPRTQMCRGSSYDMTTYGGKVFVSTNDKMISIFDPFTKDLLIDTWRPKDTIDEHINLTHICTVENESGESYLVGTATNKCIVAYNLESGQLISCLWGFGEPIVSIATIKNKIIGAGDILLTSELRDASSPSVYQNNYNSATKTTDKSRGATPPQSMMQELRISNENSFPSPEKSKPSPPGLRKAPPVRRVFQSSTSVRSSRSRSLSPTRIPAQPQAKPPLSRPSLGSPTRVAIKPGTSTETLDNPPPLRLSSSLRLASPTVDPTQRLMSALKTFNAQSTLISPDYKEELKELMFTALNKVDVFALFEHLTAKLEARIDEKFDSFKNS